MAIGDASKLGYRNDYSDKEIWLYKAGSRGEVLGIYQSISDIVELERIFNPQFKSSNITGIFSGHWKTFTSFNHQCKVKPVLKPKNG